MSQYNTHAMQEDLENRIPSNFRPPEIFYSFLDSQDASVVVDSLELFDCLALHPIILNDYT
jgi:hypothetical protein